VKNLNLFAQRSVGLPQADTYQNLFRYDIDKLIEAAKAAGISPR